MRTKEHLVFNKTVRMKTPNFLKDAKQNKTKPKRFWELNQWRLYNYTVEIGQFLSIHRK